MTTNSFSDERPVDVEFTESRDLSITAPGAGRITGLKCTPGATVSSGSAFFSIDGSSILLLATRVPLWRELVAGDTGDDVLSLQEELGRLGFRVTLDSEMGPLTFQRLHQAMKGTGTRSIDQGVATASRIAWIPAASVIIRECPISLGDSVATGDQIASFALDEPSMSVRELPNDLVSGPRLVRLGNESVPVDHVGRSIGTLPKSVLGEVAVENKLDAGKPITATLALAEPVEISSAPPSAIFGLKGTRGCVMANRRPIVVHILGSQLGQTFVSFETPNPPVRVELRPHSGAQCL